MGLSDAGFYSPSFTDKIVFSTTGTVDIAALPYDSTLVVKKLAIPHGMGRPLFISFRFKINSDISWRTGGSAESCIGYSDSTNLVILVGYGITTGTLQYEVFGSWIDDYGGATPSITVNNIVGNKVFDSRLTYRKIALQDSVVIPGNTTATNIPHGLDNSPIYQVYFDGRVGEVWQTHSGGGQDPWALSNLGGEPNDDSDCFINATTTNLVLRGHGRNFSDNITVWYRIFND